MKIKILGNVQNSKGKLEGVVELPDGEAQRLIELEVAETTTAPTQKEKPYKNMNVQDQTSKINSIQTVEELETLRAETKPTALPALEERIKALSDSSEGEQ